jgi:hypothetical protein
LDLRESLGLFQQARPVLDQGVDALRQRRARPPSSALVRLGELVRGDALKWFSSFFEKPFVWARAGSRRYRALQSLPRSRNTADHARFVPHKIAYFGVFPLLNRGKSWRGSPWIALALIK